MLETNTSSKASASIWTKFSHPNQVPPQHPTNPIQNRRPSFEQHTPWKPRNL